MSNYPPEQITNTPATEVATGHFCFVAADIFGLLYPHAELRRLSTRGKNEYKHVFVRIGDKPLDIMGFRSVCAMPSAFNIPDLIEESAYAQNVRDFFCPGYSPQQMDAAISVIAAYINAHHQEFCSTNCLHHISRQSLNHISELYKASTLANTIMMIEVPKLDIRVTDIEKQLLELQERVARLEKALQRTEGTPKGFASKGVQMVTRKCRP